jgi:hypothetical protein
VDFEHFLSKTSLFLFLLHIGFYWKCRVVIRKMTGRHFFSSLGVSTLCHTLPHTGECRRVWGWPSGLTSFLKVSLSQPPWLGMHSESPNSKSKMILNLNILSTDMTQVENSTLDSYNDHSHYSGSLKIPNQFTFRVFILGICEAWMNVMFRLWVPSPRHLIVLTQTFQSSKHFWCQAFQIKGCSTCTACTVLCSNPVIPEPCKEVFMMFQWGLQGPWGACMARVLPGVVLTCSTFSGCMLWWWEPCLISWDFPQHTPKFCIW